MVLMPLNDMVFRTFSHTVFWQVHEGSRAGDAGLQTRDVIL